MGLHLDKQSVMKIRREILQPIAKAQDVWAWLVGGCVRDMVHDEGVNDLDVVCSDVTKFIKALEKTKNC